MGKFRRVLSKLGTIKNELSNHSRIDTYDLEILQTSEKLCSFFQKKLSLARELRSHCNEHNSADDVISPFITMITHNMPHCRDKRCNARDITGIISIRSF